MIFVIAVRWQYLNILLFGLFAFKSKCNRQLSLFSHLVDQLGCLKGHSTDFTHRINYGYFYYVQTEM